MALYRKGGFTLVELMVTVAAVAILATIAYPSYVENIRKVRRSDAEGALMGLTNAMERYYTINNTYENTTQGGALPGSPLATLYPSEAPLEGATKYYDLRITDAQVGSYSLAAMPKGNTDQFKDKCGTLTLTSTGVRDTLNVYGKTAQDCW